MFAPQYPRSHCSSDDWEAALWRTCMLLCRRWKGSPVQRSLEQEPSQYDKAWSRSFCCRKERDVGRYVGVAVLDFKIVLITSW